MAWILDWKVITQLSSGKPILAPYTDYIQVAISVLLMLHKYTQYQVILDVERKAEFVTQKSLCVIDLEPRA